MRADGSQDFEFPPGYENCHATRLAEPADGCPDGLIHMPEAGHRAVIVRGENEVAHSPGSWVSGHDSAPARGMALLRSCRRVGRVACLPHVRTRKSDVLACAAELCDDLGSLGRFAFKPIRPRRGTRRRG